MPAPTWEGIPKVTAITPEFCTAQFKTFGDRDRFEEVGGFSQLNAALEIPMVLVMSIWDDHYSNMLWLDSTYPPEKAGEPGADRGPCSGDSGVPAEVEANIPNAKVIWSNIRYGPIGSTTTV
jgi:cellulose 1,4-beta-cellobiosidase